MLRNFRRAGFVINARMLSVSSMRCIIRENDLKVAIQENFQNAEIDVQDISDGCGSNFAINVRKSRNTKYAIFNFGFCIFTHEKKINFGFFCLKKKKFQMIFRRFQTVQKFLNYLSVDCLRLLRWETRRKSNANGE